MIFKMTLNLSQWTVCNYKGLFNALFRRFRVDNLHIFSFTPLKISISTADETSTKLPVTV